MPTRPANGLPFSDDHHSSYRLPLVHGPGKWSCIMLGYATRLIGKAVDQSKWQNFAAGIGTGATYITLHGLHWHPDWLTIVEIVLFLINVVIFCVNLILIIVKTICRRKDKIPSDFFDPATSVHVPLAALDYGSICLGICLYAEEFNAKNANGLEGVFWSYIVFTNILCGSMTFIWFGHVPDKLPDLRSFAMTGIFLVFPLMFAGTVAINTLRVIDPSRPSAFSIWVLGYIYQGLGMAVALVYITIHFYRAIEYGFHRGAAANSTFFAVGPPGFTALTILELGSHGRKILPLHTPLPQEAADAIYYSSIPVAFCFLGYAIYCWAFAACPYMFTLRKHIGLNPAGKVHLFFNGLAIVTLHTIAAWPLTSPAVGFISALSIFGDIFNSQVFFYAHAFFTAYVCLAFVILLPTWIYRLIVPTDTSLLELRAKCFEDDSLDFWSAVRAADEAERKFKHKIERFESCDVSFKA